MEALVRFRSRILVLPLSLALAAWVVQSAPAIEAIRGTGHWSLPLGCAACGGGLLMSFFGGGLGFVAWALWTPLGSAAVVGCGSTCLGAVLL